MQTFLPYPSFARSARVMDTRRLGKQRVEALQILRALHIDDYGWRNHPVVRMWRGYEDGLVAYGLAVTREWVARGHGDTCRDQIAEFASGPDLPSQRELAARGRLPDWIGWEPLHRAHRSALVRKDPAHYRRFFPDVPDDLPYVWPETPKEPPAAVEPFTAWVLRGSSRQMTEELMEADVVALPDLTLGAKRANTKGERQVTAFMHEPRVGDALVVPHDGQLRLGEIRSAYRRGRDPALPHVRAIRWLGDVPRSVLRRPAKLQDPRLFFALRGEGDLRARLDRAPSSKKARRSG